MTRLESGLPGVEPGGEELQKLIQHEAKKLRPQTKVIKKRPFFSCFNCSLVVLVILLVLAGWLLSLVAKSGLLPVPVFSDIFYQTPEPIHWVKVSAGQSPELLLSPNLGSKILILKEENLTQMLQISIDQTNARQKRINIDFAQIAVDEEKVELFVKFNKPVKVYLAIGLLPQLENQQLMFNTVSLKIGSLEIPIAWVGSFFDRLINRQLGNVLTDLPLIFKKINLASGEIKIDFEVDLSKINLNVQ